jgi:hypothetical protein
MKRNLQSILMVVAMLVVAGAIFRQEREISRLRAVIAESTNLHNNVTAISTVTNPLPGDLEELRREAAEVHRLRAEVAQLRREEVKTNALAARIDKLAADVSAILANVNRKSDSIDIGGFNQREPNTSPLVLKASALAQSSPEEAAQLVAAMPPGKEQDQAALAVIDRWTGTNPLAAAAWTTGFPEGTLREQAMSLVARQWGLSDWNATSAWLEKLPMGASRDAAIGSFVTSADGNDINLALEWANRMDDPESRAARVEQTARRWLRENNAAARAWIEKAQLPSGMAERLLSEK